MKFKFNSRVKILVSKKSDSRFNTGKVIGIDLLEDKFYLGYTSEKEYFSRFTLPRYKVAYVDCFTNKAGYAWFMEDELEKV